MLSTAAAAMIDPVLVSDEATLTRYAEALFHFALVAEGMGKNAHAERLLNRAYYLLTLAR